MDPSRHLRVPVGLEKAGKADINNVRKTNSSRRVQRSATGLARIIHCEKPINSDARPFGSASVPKAGRLRAKPNCARKIRDQTRDSHHRPAGERVNANFRSRAQCKGRICAKKSSGDHFGMVTEKTNVAVRRF